MSTQDPDKDDSDDSGIKFKQAVFARDRHRCNNCHRDISNVVTLDPDHTVQRGAGGSNRMSNVGALCRRCHDAKHGDGIAPCAQVASSGQMTDAEFVWFKQLVDEMIPALANKYGVNLEPLYGLDDSDCWFFPRGDLHLLDEKLKEDDTLDGYTSLQPEQYM
jgi:hypothetical protein